MRRVFVDRAYVSGPQVTLGGRRGILERAVYNIPFRRYLIKNTSKNSSARPDVKELSTSIHKAPWCPAGADRAMWLYTQWRVNPKPRLTIGATSPSLAHTVHRQASGSHRSGNLLTVHTTHQRVFKMASTLLTEQSKGTSKRTNG